jgi:predicted nucleic acid-binding protein
MERVFADIGYWIALLNPRDDLHNKAAAVLRDYGLGQIVTSEMVLTEFLNSFSDYGPRLRQAALDVKNIGSGNMRESITLIVWTNASRLSSPGFHGGPERRQ